MDYAEGGAASEWRPDEENDDEFTPRPPPIKVNPYYSVARQRARMRIKHARTCGDLELKRQRLAAALEAATVAGLPDPSIVSVEEELISVEGATRALHARTPTPEPPRSAPAPMRPVTPVNLRGVGGVKFGPNLLGLLTLSDDGMAEIRDAYCPQAAPQFTCQAFEPSPSLVPRASVFTTVQENDRSAGIPRDTFRLGAVWELLDECEPFRAVIAVVDPLRIGGQLLCSRVLAKGPQGALVGAVVATPGVDTPAPFSGPAYGGLATLLCLGSEANGLGGLGWANGGVFGRCFAFADRAAAYVGGWPSESVGKLAYSVAQAADAARGPGGSAGSFLFGHVIGSPEESARAESVNTWLRGAAQAGHTSQAWVEHFTTAGVFEAEHNEGPMWLEASSKSGRWCHQAGLPAVAEGKSGDDEDGDADADGDDEEAAAAAKAKAAAEAAKARAKASQMEDTGAGAPPKEKELPPPPPLALSTPCQAKICVPFGVFASQLVGALTIQLEGEFQRRQDEEFPELSLPANAEVLAVIDLIDLSDPRVFKWKDTWKAWSDAAKEAKGVLVAVVLLPANDAPDIEWRLMAPALDALIDFFDLVVFLQNGVADGENSRAVLSALLDPGVPMSLMQAHLTPYRRFHFAIAYCASTADELSSDLEASALVGTQSLPSQDVDHQAVIAEFESKGVGAQEVRAAVERGLAFTEELKRHCGFRVVEASEAPEANPAPAEPTGDDEEAPADEDADADAEVADGTAEIGDASAAAPGAADAGDDDIFTDGEASLLSFFVGSSEAGVPVEHAMKVRGAELRGGDEGPSLAYPVSCYGFGCVPPKPWGARWSSGRSEVVVFAVHTRIICGIIERIVSNLHVPLKEGGAEEAGAEEAGADQGRAPEDELDEQAVELSAVEAAAIRIQSLARGSIARKEAALKMEAPGEDGPESGQPPEHGDDQEQDPEEAFGEEGQYAQEGEDREEGFDAQEGEDREEGLDAQEGQYGEEGQDAQEGEYAEGEYGEENAGDEQAYDDQDVGEFGQEEGAYAEEGVEQEGDAPYEEGDEEGEAFGEEGDAPYEEGDEQEPGA